MCGRKKRFSDLVVISGGMNSTLQPLDVVLNKLFKDWLRELYNKTVVPMNQYK